MAVAAVLAYWGISGSTKGGDDCNSERRLLKDGEFVDIAVAKLVDNLHKEMKLLSVGDKLNLIEYKSVSDFYKKQPDCCRGRDATFRSFELDGPYNPDSVRVRIFYKHDYDGPKPYRRAEVLVHKCGTSSEVVAEKTDITSVPTGLPYAKSRTGL